MAQTCSICSHKKVEEINAALLMSRSLRLIAGQWHASKSALARHKIDHIPALLAKARDVVEVCSADSLLAQMRSLHKSTLDILAAAQTAGHLETALRAIREARGNVELLARLDGLLRDRAPVADTDLAGLSFEDLSQIECILERRTVSIRLRSEPEKVHGGEVFLERKKGEAVNSYLAIESRSESDKGDINAK